MEIRLSPELEAAVERAVAAGRYGSAEEYVAVAVELLEEREQWLGESPEEFNAKLEASIAEAERGELMSLEDARREMQKMKVERVARGPRD
ncbi:MAG TPA: type II toxin-antitoxin system ParD family antitoxin [Granulicella sp.]|jgi:putative addiction module CopG family antidote|nr:type II toxin-antitoxin system ParD family antitoxin [Granulicella sp.]